MLFRHRLRRLSALTTIPGRLGQAPVLALLLTTVLAVALHQVHRPPSATTAQGQDPLLGPDHPPALLGQYGGEVTALHRAGDRLYAGIGGRLAVFAIGADSSLTLLGQSGALAERINAIVTDQGHAYLAAGSAGLLALDLGDESAPRLVGRVQTPGEGGLPGSAVDLAIEDHRAYVATDASLRMVDLAEPGAPVELGTLAIAATAVASWQGHAYLLSGGGLAVVDARQPDRPRLATWLRPSEGSDWTGLTQSEGWLVVAGSELQTFALTPPGRPRSTSRLALGKPYQRIARLAASGSRLLVEVSRDEGTKLMLVDRSDPAVPREERLLSSPGGLTDLIPGVSSDHWLAARAYAGVVELDLSDQEASEARQIDRVPSFGIARAEISGSLAVVEAVDGKSAVIDLRSDDRWPIHLGPRFAYPSFMDQLSIHGDTVYMANPIGLERLRLDRGLPGLESMGVDKSFNLEALQVKGDRAYALAQHSGAFQVFALSAEGAPRLQGSLELPSMWPMVRRLLVEGNHAYVLSSQGLTVIDVADPGAPRLLGRGDTVGSYPGPGSAGTTGGMAARENLVVVGLDRFGMSWMDVSSATSPKQVASLDLVLPGFQRINAHQPAFVGQHLLTSYQAQTWRSYVSGLAWITMDASGMPVAASNFWSQASPIISDFRRSGNHLLLSDERRGLSIWRLDQTSPPTATPPVRPTASPRPAPTDAARPQRAFVPFLSLPAPKPPADDARRLREVSTLGGRPEALVISGDLLYLGVGSAIETYDISVPGKARRLSRSAAVGGRIVRLALGSDRLFALSRPAIDWAVAPPTPDETPPWTLLSVFDISEATAPRQMGKTTAITGRSERGAPLNLFATDLAAYGRTAYLTVYERSGPWGGLGEASLFGIVIVDGGSIPLHYRFDPGLVRRGFRPLVHGGRLYVRGDLPEDRAQEQGFDTGVMGFDLAEPLAPRWLGAAGNLMLDVSTTRFDLVGHGEHLFHVYDSGILVPIEILADGRPQLMGDRQDWMTGLIQGSLSLHTDAQGLLRSAAAPGRLYLLVPNLGETPVVGFDVRDPLHPERLPWFGIGGLDLLWSQTEMEARDHRPDLGADLAATTDGRLFLAAGRGRVLVELDVSDPDNQHELARYAVGQAADCSLIADGKLIQVDLASGTLSLRDLADPQQLPLVGSAAVDLGTSCALAADGPWLYAAGSKGLSVIDLTDPAAPRTRGSLALEGEARQVLADGPRVYLAAGREGLWTLDVSDADAPAALGHLATPGSTQGLAADGDRLYLADGFAGLTVVDISDPSAPRETEALLRGEGIVAVARRGDWVYASSVPWATGHPAELISLQGEGPLMVRSRWPLGSEGIMAIDRSSGTDLFVQDGPGSVRWLDLTEGLPQSRDLLSIEGPLDALVAGEGWVLAGGPSQRLLRHDDP